MLLFLAIVHVLVALGLILFVLLQDPKGGAMGVFGGGSSNSVFGATGGSNFLTKVTRSLAVLFAFTCIAMAYITTQPGTSLMDEYMPAGPQTPSPEVETTAPEAHETPVEQIPTEETQEAPQ